MDAYEPRVRRRGFFLHSDTTGEPDTGEHENPEGLVARVRFAPTDHPRHVGAIAASNAGLSRGRSRTDAPPNEALPQFRSGNVTGSRQRVHLPR